MQEFISVLHTRVTRVSRSTLVDITLIGIVAIVVALIHAVSTADLRAQLALDYYAPDLPSFFTSAFVHHNLTHLLNNLTGFLFAVGVAYGLSRNVDHRRWFRITLGVLILFLPVLVSLTSYSVITGFEPGIEGTSRGFSGVVGGCIGFAFTAVLIRIGNRQEWFVSGHVAMILITGSLMWLSVNYTGTVQWKVGLLAIIGMGLGTQQLLAQLPLQDSEYVWQVIAERADEILALVLIGFLTVKLFPADVTTDGVATNIIAHGAGLILGACLSGIVYALLQLHGGDRMYS